MTSGEQTLAEAREAELAKVWKRMGKAARRGDSERYEELKAEHDRLKAEHVTLSHEERIAELRARVAARRAQEAYERPERWRLPRGFASPLAQQRARAGRPEVPVIPVGRPALNPWRRVPSMAEVIWRPGS